MQRHGKFDADSPVPILNYRGYLTRDGEKIHFSPFINGELNTSQLLLDGCQRKIVLFCLSISDA